MSEKPEIHQEDLCIWQDNEKCKGCVVKGELHCHLDKNHSLWFGLGYFSSAIPAFVGLILIPGALKWIAIGVWVGYMVIFFQFWEPFILCSHCPFYAEEGTRILHCSINYGFFKITHYRPQPISTWEEIQFIIGITLLMAIPFPFLLVTSKWVPLWLNVAGTLVFALVLRYKTCTECINLSCPLNRLDEEKKAAFLECNPKLKKYYEKIL